MALFRAKHGSRKFTRAHKKNATSLLLHVVFRREQRCVPALNTVVCMGIRP
jgi:hypothetical protein